MRAFWQLFGIFLVGMAVATWFLLRGLNAPAIGLLFGLAWAALVGMSIIIYMCYLSYAGKLPGPRTAMEARSILFREIVVMTPLWIGAGCFFWFLATGRMTYITPVMIASLACWLVLRFLCMTKPKGPR